MGTVYYHNNEILIVQHIPIPRSVPITTHCFLVGRLDVHILFLGPSVCQIQHLSSSFQVFINDVLYSPPVPTTLCEL